jgi:hypothetical protein
MTFETSHNVRPAEVHFSFVKSGAKLDHYVGVKPYQSIAAKCWICGVEGPLERSERGPSTPQRVGLGVGQ